jgi:hypothetical protein
MMRALDQAWTFVSAMMARWYETKMFIEHVSVVSSDALHVLVGVIVWLLVALLWRRPTSSWRPWSVLLGFTLFNEAVDLWVERWPDPAMQYGESVKDILLTMALPTVLLLAVRARPSLFSSIGGSRR